MASPATRKTRQGDAVALVLAETSEFRSAQDVHAELRRRGERVGLTTVYRHLQTLADRGLVDVVLTADGEAVYRQCASTAHHHHLVCRRCGTAVEVDGPEIELWAERVARGAGFTDVAHTVEIFGTCHECAGRRGQ